MLKPKILLRNTFAFFARNSVLICSFGLVTFDGGWRILGFILAVIPAILIGLPLALISSGIAALISFIYHKINKPYHLKAMNTDPFFVEFRKDFFEGADKAIIRFENTLYYVSEHDFIVKKLFSTSESQPAYTELLSGIIFEEEHRDYIFKPGCKLANARQLDLISSVIGDQLEHVPRHPLQPSVPIDPVIRRHIFFEKKAELTEKIKQFLTFLNFIHINKLPETRRMYDLAQRNANLFQVEITKLESKLQDEEYKVEYKKQNDNEESANLQQQLRSLHHSHNEATQAILSTKWVTQNYNPALLQHIEETNRLQGEMTRIDCEDALRRSAWRYGSLFSRVRHAPYVNDEESNHLVLKNDYSYAFVLFKLMQQLHRQSQLPMDIVKEIALMLVSKEISRMEVNHLFQASSLNSSTISYS